MNLRLGQLIGVLTLWIIAAAIFILNESTISSKFAKWRDEHRDESIRSARLQLFNIYMELARKGDPGAQFNVGLYYFHGVAPERNSAEAVKWWLKSAESGYAKAQSKLGDCFSTGEGVTKDIPAGLNWHRMAAAQGDSRSHIWLSKQHLDGGLVSTDKIEAFAYLTLAKRYSESSLEPSEKWTVTSHSLLFSIDPAVTEETRTLGNKRADVLQKEIEAKIATKKAGK